MSGWLGLNKSVCIFMGMWSISLAAKKDVRTSNTSCTTGDIDIQISSSAYGIRGLKITDIKITNMNIL